MQALINNIFGALLLFHSHHSPPGFYNVSYPDPPEELPETTERETTEFMTTGTPIVSGT